MRLGHPAYTQRTPSEFYENVIEENHRPARTKAMFYLRDVVKRWALLREFFKRLLQPQDPVVECDSF